MIEGATTRQDGGRQRPEDFGTSPEGVARRWIVEIEAAQKFVKDWHKRGEKILKRYRDDRITEAQNRDRRLNVLWSNVQTLLPAIYSATPRPVVERRNRDRDQMGIAASMVLERALKFEIERGNLDRAARQATFDLAVPGQGQIWVTYRADVSQPDADGDADEYGDAPRPDAVRQCIDFDYVNWRDYYQSPARVWEEVTWVGRRVFLTRDQLMGRFDPEIARRIPLDHKPERDTTKGGEPGPEEEVFHRAVVFEIWDKPSRKVYWIAPSYGEAPLDVKDDPAKLEGFFPCPRPLAASHTNDSTIPIPDYAQYQDQAEELDDLTRRIAALTKSLKAVGVYNAANKEISRIYQEGVDNTLIPVNDWASFSERGGLKGAVDFVPLVDVVNTVTQLYAARAQVKQDLYEISGISDIVRGQTSPSETATAQRIKGQFATLRLDDRKKDVQRFVRDLIAIAGELIAEHFDDMTLWEMSNWSATDQAQTMVQAAMKAAQAQAQQVMQQAQQAGMQVPPPPLPQPEQIARQIFARAIQMLRSDKTRGFMISIETDSTIAVDEQEDKQSRVEFLTASGGFLREAMGAAQTAPELMPLLTKMLLFGVRGFRAGRDLEAAFEDMASQVDQQVKAKQQNPQPNPEQAKQQAEMQRTQAEVEVMKLKAQVEAASLKAEAEAKAREHQWRMEEMALSHQIKMAELQARVAEMQAGAAMESRQQSNGAEERQEGEAVS